MPIKNLNTVPYLHEDRPGKLGAKILGFTQIGRRDLVDQTGLVGGIYINTSHAMDRGNYICQSDPNCVAELVALESRIQMAIDEDQRLYSIPQLEEEDEDIVDLLYETNLKVIYCVKHKQGLLMPLVPDINAPSAKLYALSGYLIEMNNIGPAHIYDQIRKKTSTVIDLKEWLRKNGKNTKPKTT